MGLEIDLDETVAALADVATSAARSLFSFAAFSLKTVTEVAATVSAGAGAGAAGVVAASAAAAAASSPGGITLVGKTRVVVIKEIAEGAFGTVFLAQDASNPSRRFALKQMLCQSKEQTSDAMAELQALQRFSGLCENIIELVDHGSSSSKQSGHRQVLFLFPLYSNGSAWDAVERAVPVDAEGCPWPFSEHRALKVLMGAARALEAMHAEGYAHRDVSTINNYIILKFITSTHSVSLLFSNLLFYFQKYLSLLSHHQQDKTP